MSNFTKILLSCIGVAIGGAGLFYEVHAKDVIDARFWLGLAFAALLPVGTYFVGLAQRAPWEGPTLPTSVTRTEKTVTDPPPAADTKPPGG